MSRVQVPFAVSREVAFDYLVDPRNRIQWQSSLRRVEDVSPIPPQAGTAWREAALGGVTSQMELTAVERPSRWVEVGRSGRLRMGLALTFEESPAGCLVICDLDLAGEGRARLVGRVLSRAFPFAVRRDLTRAAGILDGTFEPRDP